MGLSFALSFVNSVADLTMCAHYKQQCMLLVWSYVGGEKDVKCVI